MKKAYNSPKLIVHGDVQEITQAFGPSTVSDVVFIGGSNVPTNLTSTGSTDGMIMPT